MSPRCTIRPPRAYVRSCRYGGPSRCSQLESRASASPQRPAVHVSQRAVAIVRIRGPPRTCTTARRRRAPARTRRAGSAGRARCAAGRSRWPSSGRAPGEPGQAVGGGHPAGVGDRVGDDGVAAQAPAEPVVEAPSQLPRGHAHGGGVERLAELGVPHCELHEVDGRRATRPGRRGDELAEPGPNARDAEAGLEAVGVDGVAEPHRAPGSPRPCPGRARPARRPAAPRRRPARGPGARRGFRRRRAAPGGNAGPAGAPPSAAPRSRRASPTVAPRRTRRAAARARTAGCLR